MSDGQPDVTTGPPGIRCPKCGGTSLPVFTTRRRAGSMMRVRKCARCNHRIRTCETVVSADDRGRSKPVG